ncbi:MAG: phosphoribosylformylglycinamidine synthase subunit PurS [Syntrophaceticus sp.]
MRGWERIWWPQTAITTYPHALSNTGEVRVSVACFRYIFRYIQIHNEVLCTIVDEEGKQLFEARIYITLKKGILDPDGKAIKKGLLALGYEQVEELKTGKYIVLTLKSADRNTAEEEVKEMCDKLLVNKVMEEYTFELREVER